MRKLIGIWGNCYGFEVDNEVTGVDLYDSLGEKAWEYFLTERRGFYFIGENRYYGWKMAKAKNDLDLWDIDDLEDNWKNSPCYFNESDLFNFMWKYHQQYEELRDLLNDYFETQFGYSSCVCPGCNRVIVETNLKEEDFFDGHSECCTKCMKKKKKEKKKKKKKKKRRCSSTPSTPMNSPTKRARVKQTHRYIDGEFVPVSRELQ